MAGAPPPVHLVVIITTPSNAPFIVSETSKHHNISMSIISFPRVPELPEGCENTVDLPSMAMFSTFVKATKKMKQPFERVHIDMIVDGHPPICVISDFFLSWTLDSCHSFKITRIVSHGMGALSMAICKSLTLLPLRTKPSLELDPIELLTLTLPFTLQKVDIPKGLLDYNPNYPYARIIVETKEADINSWGVLVHSFEELEGDHVGAFESFYFNNAKAYCLGTFFLYNELFLFLHKRLEKQANSDGHTVIYLSFGTQAHLLVDQLNEIAFGLDMAEHPFIWVKERVKEKGLVLHDWADQRNILSHPAIGGFLSHCGWNSMLEHFNRLMIPHRGDSGEKITTVGCDVICDRVKELMEGGKGRKAREKAQVLGRMARGAVEKGGSFDKKLDQLIGQLSNNKNEKS
ncbi:hypothetical protein I3843_16G062100 [Carya illinoinensis]|nr:hypothetical protein I3760_16G063600 [Carya illinoinensis]KAG7941756.1 hypothetical protein I3843_16G062100 [Carya illinoinensis]